MTGFTQLYVFVLAGFVGFLIISRVPALLHTPLMSATNAISAISVVGAIVAAGSDHRLAQILGFVAVTCATINVVGGFLITDRMLRMFQRGRKPAALAPAADAAAVAATGAGAESGAVRRDQA